MSRKKNRSAQVSHSATQPSAPAPTANWLLWTIFAAIGAYLMLFFLTPLEQTAQAEGAQPLRRIDVVVNLLLLPDELVASWGGPPGWNGLVDRAGILIVAGAIAAAAGASGWLIMRACGMRDGLSRLEVGVFSFGVGLNAVSLFTLVIGLAGRLHNRWVFFAPGAAVVVAALLLAWKRSGGEEAKRGEGEEGKGGKGEGAKGRRGDEESRGREQSTSSSDSSFILQPPSFSSDSSFIIPPSSVSSDSSFILHPSSFLFALPFFAAILAGSMLPPLDFDVREYHLQAPKEFYQSGEIGFLPHNVYANMPLGAEMLALTAMAVRGDWWWGALAGKVLIGLFTPLTAAALFAAGRRFWNPAAGTVAALVYLSIPWISVVSTSGLIEGASACYLWLAVYAALIWRDEVASGQPHAMGKLMLAGFLAGAAVACKYPAVLFVVCPLAVFAVCVSYKFAAHDGAAGWRRPAVATIVLLAAVFAGCGPWLAKNFALTGNPVYPLAYGVFDGKTRTADKHAQWRRAHSPANYSLDDLAQRTGDILWRNGRLSPLVVPLAALAFIRRRRFALLLAGIAVFYLLSWWLFTHRIDRFWVPILPLAAILAGIGATWSDAVVWRRILIGVLIVGLSVSFLFVSSPLGGDNRYLAGLDSLRDDSERITDPWHRYLNRTIPPGDAVLCVGEAEVFDLTMPVYYSTVFDDCLFETWTKDRTPDEIAATLRERKITRVYVDWGEIARYRSPGNYGFTDYVQPEVFSKLVEEGVLTPPLPRSVLGADEATMGEVYGVEAKG